jgi:signal transduction histidine kinase
VLVAGEQQERLIEALLTLARSQRGIERRERLDLGDLAGEAVQSAPWNGVLVESDLDEAPAVGDSALVERLVANLVDNAIHHNDERGWVRVWTGLSGGRPAIRIANSGPIVRPDQVDALVEPFRRLNGDRARHRQGLGLGLSIVRAIAVAHDAELRAMPRAEGGLEVEVRFPAVSAGAPSRAASTLARDAIAAGGRSDPGGADR